MSRQKHVSLVASLREKFGTDLDVLKLRLDSISEERKVLLASIKPVQKALTDGWQESQALNVLIEQVELESMQSNGVDWNVLLNNQDSMAVYKLFQTEIRNLGLVPDGGYWVDTEQRAIRISLIKGDEESLDQHISALNLLFPYLKPSEGLIKFKVSEESLCEGGSWRLEVDPDTQSSRLSLTQFGKKQIKAEFSNLREALVYIQTNLYSSKVSDQTFKM